MSRVQQQVASLSTKVDDKANDLFASVTGFNPTHYFRQYLPVYQTHTPGKRLTVSSSLLALNAIQIYLLSRHLPAEHDTLRSNGTVGRVAKV